MKKGTWTNPKKSKKAVFIGFYVWDDMGGRYFKLKPRDGGGRPFEFNSHQNAKELGWVKKGAA
jgi:hypothetical protein